MIYWGYFLFLSERECQLITSGHWDFTSIASNKPGYMDTLLK